jgi:hypothetical protein
MAHYLWENEVRKPMELMETRETPSMSHKLLVEYQYITALIKPNTTNISYRFRGFWVSEFQETWKLVKTSKNSESILTFCWWLLTRRTPFEFPFSDTKLCNISAGKMVLFNTNPFISGDVEEDRWCGWRGGICWHVSRGRGQKDSEINTTYVHLNLKSCKCIFIGRITGLQWHK